MENEEGFSTITKEQLLENGWHAPESREERFLYPLCKDLADPEQEQDEDGQVKMVIHMNYNTPMFALLITGGYLININPANIEELIAFENQIVSVDPPY